MAQSFTAAPELTLILSTGGVIQEAIVGAGLADEQLDDWIGRTWASTVEEPGSAKVQRLLESAQRDRVCGFSQITQRLPSGRELLMEFSAVRPKAHEQVVVAIGRNLNLVVEQQKKLLAARQEIEHEYWKLRDIERRYNAMISSTSEAVVLIRGEDLEIIEANVLARRLLSIGGSRRRTLELGADETRLRNVLRETRRAAHGPSTLVRLGPDRTAFRVKATLVRGTHEPQFLLRFDAVKNGMATARTRPTSGAPMQGFLVVGADGSVQMANSAFAELVGAGRAEGLLGRPISAWFGTVDMADMRSLAGGDALATTLYAQSLAPLPVMMSVWDLEAAQAGALALLIEAETSSSAFH